MTLAWEFKLMTLQAKLNGLAVMELQYWKHAKKPEQQLTKKNYYYFDEAS